MSETDLFENLDRVKTRVSLCLGGNNFADLLQPPCLAAGVKAYPGRAGKMMRPALLLWSCGLFGGDLVKALPIATAVEMFHTWTLVHDDIIDQDEIRRGGPSVHALVRDMQEGGLDTAAAARFGENMAILAGDVQHAWSNHLIATAAEIPAELRLRILERLNGMVTPLLISGEAMDVEFELKPFAEISSDDMETMLRYKTALLLRFAAETGAMIGCDTDDLENPAVKRMGQFAENVGMAFQLKDDLLGMFGDEDKLGKPVGSDLHQGKRTYLFALAIEKLHEAGKNELEELLSRENSDADLAKAQELLRACGVVEQVEKRIAMFITSARTNLEQMPEGRFRELLFDLADYTVTRDK